jgi:hypothetical protein
MARRAGLVFAGDLSTTGHGCAATRLLFRPLAFPLSPSPI